MVTHVRKVMKQTLELLINVRTEEHTTFLKDASVKLDFTVKNVNLHMPKHVKMKKHLVKTVELVMMQKDVNVQLVLEVSFVS